MKALLYPAILAAAGLAAWLSYARKKKRRTELTAFASANGMQYSRVDPFGLVDMTFDFFSRGDGRGCENVVWGSWQGFPSIAADFWYYERTENGRGARSKTYHHFSVAVVRLEAWLPHVCISHENVLTSLAEHIGLAGISFESEQFNRQHHVTSGDPEGAFKLIDARMMQWMLSIPQEFGFEINGPKYVVFSRRTPVAGLVPLLGVAKGFSDHIPRLAWTDFGLTAKAEPTLAAAGSASTWALGGSAPSVAPPVSPGVRPGAGPAAPPESGTVFGAPTPS